MNTSQSARLQFLTYICQSEAKTADIADTNKLELIIENSEYPLSNSDSKHILNPIKNYLDMSKDCRSELFKKLQLSIFIFFQWLQN